MTDLHDSSFVINDIELEIPPSQIRINHNTSVRELRALRNRSSKKAKSGQSLINISINAIFVGAEAVNNQLRPLVAQLRLTPFCYVENKKIRDSVLGGSEKGQSMALALSDLTVSTIPGSPGSLQATFSFVWFNYLPYTPNFFFKTNPLIPLGQRRPGLAFKYFYAPQLRLHDPITFSNSNLTAEINRFLIGPAQNFNDDVSLDIETPKLKDFSASLTEYKNILREFEARAESDVIASGNQGLFNNEKYLTGMEELAEASFMIDGNDPTINNQAFISKTVKVVNSLVRTIDSAVIKTAAKEDPTNKLLKKLTKARDELLNKGGKLFSGGESWLEFPSELVLDDNKFSINKDDDPSTLYFRRDQLSMGKKEDKLVVEQVSVILSHHLVFIPMAGYAYPTCQYMGSSDMRASLSIKAFGDGASQSLAALYNVQQNNSVNARFIPQQYCNVSIKNEIFQLMGMKDVIIERKVEDTVPNHPGTYNVTLDMVESGIELENDEGFTAVPTSNHEVRKAVIKSILENVDINRVDATPAAVSFGSVRAGTGAVLGSSAPSVYSPRVVPGGDVAERNSLAEIQLVQKVIDQRFGLNNVISGVVDLLISGKTIVDIDAGYVVDQVSNSTGLNPQKYAVDTAQGVSPGFNNLLTLSSLEDDEILGIEGITALMWKHADVNLSRPGFKKSGTVILPSDKQTEAYQLGESKQRQRLRLLKERRIFSRAERYKKLLGAREKIQRFRAARDAGLIIDSTKVTALNGEVLDITEILDEAGLTSGFRDEVIRIGNEDFFAPVAYEETGIIAGLRRTVREVAPEFSDSLVGDAQEDHINSVLKQLEAELLGQVNSVEDGFEPGSVVQAVLNQSVYLQQWATAAKVIADEIMFSDLINLPMFSEAKKIQEKMTTISRGNVYKDFPLEEIRGLITNSLGQQGNSDTFIEIEPDFYFLNETADLDVSNFVSEEVVEEGREYSKRYVDEVLKNDNNWFNGAYLKKVNEKFGSMIRQSAGDKDMQSSNTGLDSVSASLTFQNPLKVSRKSSQNAKTVRGRNIKAAQFSLNEVPENASPRAVNTIESSDLGSTAVNSSIAQLAANPEELNASEVWGMPIKGNFRISSYPGYRNVSGGSAYHEGIDFAHLPKGQGASYGKPVYSVAQGEVISKNTNENLPEGLSVGIRSSSAGEEYKHQYFHLLAHATGGGLYEIGDVVEKGQLLGWIGNTGSSTSPHLHFQVKRFDGNAFTEPVWPFGTYKSDFINEDPSRPIALVPLIQWEGSDIPVTPQHGLSGSATVFDRALESLKASWNKNTGYRMNRAYPGVYMSFIEESFGREILRFDKFFNYNSIVSLEMVRDREVAADYCRMVVTNISGILTNRKFRGTYGEDEVQGTKSLNPIHEDTAKQTLIDSVMLKEGMNVEVRLGYSNNPENLARPFVGKIVSVQADETDDLMVIEMQSLATELVQTLHGQDEAEVYSNTYGSDEADTGHLLTSLISSPECVSFGMWERGDRIGNENRDLLTDRWEWRPTPSTDNIFVPPKDQMSALDPKFFWDKMKYFMFNYTIWDVFKEMELRHPEYISYAVPYEETNGSRVRMTMFFGLPDQLYFSKDPSIGENQKVADLRSKKKGLSDNLLKGLQEGSFLRNARELLARGGIPKEETDALIRKASRQPETVTAAGHTPDLERISEGFVDRFIESERLKLALDTGAIQPFRRYHLLTSEQHIISNNIKSQSSNTFNAVTVKYADPGFFDIGASDAVETGTTGEPRIKSSAKITMKLDPTIPDENVRQNFTVYPNCIGEEMAKRYCVSLLQKGTWQIYEGDIVILGNPDIKPYDVCYINDSYSDMVGPIQARRVTHLLSHDEGFITIITPDCFSTVTEGATMTQNQAMGLMAESIIRKTLMTKRTNVITPGETPLDGVQTTPLQYEALVGIGKLVNFYGGRRLIFNTQFKEPIRVYPLMKDGRPMVAGFGPENVMDNMFWWNELKEEVRTGWKGINDWNNSFRRGLAEGRIWETRGALFGEEGTKRIRLNRNGDGS